MDGWCEVEMLQEEGESFCSRLFFLVDRLLLAAATATCSAGGVGFACGVWVDAGDGSGHLAVILRMGIGFAGHHGVALGGVVEEDGFDDGGFR